MKSQAEIETDLLAWARKALTVAGRERLLTGDRLPTVAGVLYRAQFPQPERRCCK